MSYRNVVLIGMICALVIMPITGFTASMTKKTNAKKVTSTVKKKKPVLTLVAERKKGTTDAPTTFKHSAIVVYDETIKKNLLAIEQERVWPLASITKLATSLVLLDQTKNFKKIISIQAGDEVEGARLRVTAGTPITVREALTITLIGSANNTANALVRATGLSRAAFIDRMNKKAKALGMMQTHFVDPSGIEPGNVSSAHDIVVLAQTALKNPTIQSILLLKQYRWYNRKTRSYHTIKNTNKLLGNASFKVLGGKTGLLNEAGSNVVMRVSDGHHPLTIVVLGAQSLPDSFRAVHGLAVWAWKSFAWVKKK